MKLYHRKCLHEVQKDTNKFSCSICKEEVDKQSLIIYLNDIESLFSKLRILNNKLRCTCPQCSNCYYGLNEVLDILEKYIEKT